MSITERREQSRSSGSRSSDGCKSEECCGQHSLDSRDWWGVPGLRHGGFFSGGRTATFYTSTPSVETHRPGRTQTSLSITDHKEVPLQVRGSDCSWITTPSLLFYNTLPVMGNSSLIFHLRCPQSIASQSLHRHIALD